MNRVLLLIPLLFLYSCKSYDVLPGAERVRVFENEPKGCIYVGEVSSVQEDETVGTLETEMDLATRIDLRNKAHKLGGNIIVFLKGRRTNTLPGSAPIAPATGKPATSTDAKVDAKAEPAEKSSDEKTLIFIATVFRCPSSVLNQ